MNQKNSMEDKKKHYLYLAGNISEDKRTFQWREEFTELMSGTGITIVNPCASKFGAWQKKTKISDGLKFAKKTMKKSQKILRARDYQLISICSIIVVNLELYSPNKPMIGTVQELCWASDIFYLPVIGITGGSDNIYVNHPWIDECCSAKVETVKDSVEMVKTFFLDY